MTERFFDKLDELSLELKKLSERDKSKTKIDKTQIAKDALDKIEDIDRTINIIDGLINEKLCILKPNTNNNVRTEIELSSLKCYKNELMRSRAEWILVAENNLSSQKINTLNKTKII